MDISEQIKNAAPAFEPAYAAKALDKVNVYLFRYFPKKKMLVATEKTCRDFGCKPVYYDMPGSFGDEFVYKKDREIYEHMYKEIDSGNETSSAEFRSKDGKIWCRVILTTMEWDEDKRPELCVGVIENRSELKNREQLLLIKTMQSRLMEFLNCGIFSYTLPDHEILLVNNEAMRLFSCEQEDKSDFYENMMHHILSQDISSIRNAVQRLRSPGDHVEYKLHSRQDDGTIITITCFTQLLSFDEGKRFILSVMQDVTKQEEMERLLFCERKRYRDAVTFNSEYSYDFDVTEGILYADFTYSKKGTTIAEQLGISFPVSYDDVEKAWLKKMRPEFLTQAEYNYMTSKGLAACYEQGITHISMDFFLPFKERYFRKNILLSKDDWNNHVMAVVYVTDITENVREDVRKRNELARTNRILQKQVELTQSFSSIYFGSGEANLETGKFVEITVPDWAHETFKKTENDLRKAIDIIAHSFVAEEFQEIVMDFLNLDTLAQRLQDQRILSCEFLEKHYGWSELELIPVKYDQDGKAVRILFAIRSIANKKKLELEAKKALQEAYEAANRASIAKTNFLASMSHDIRTPMNAIIGMTAIAGAHIDDKDRVADCLSKITVSSKHLLGLINEVLDMNKIESGKLNLFAEEFNLSDLIDNLLTMSKPQIEKKKHNLFVNNQGVEHEKVIGDSQRIQQVFMNLMSNAVKYTPEGGTIHLSIREKQTERSKVGCYEFVFEDNGIGMSEEFLPQVFEPFSRAKDIRVEKTQGTGLGMPITRNIVRMMNGDIKVESRLNEGTKITVTIFLELQEKEEDFRNEAFRDLSVLVVDDDKVACESTCEVLKELGMNGEWVLSGEEALSYAVKCQTEKKNLFAIMIDWKMPGMDAIETTKEIRKAIGSEVPIIVISAYDWSEIELEARAVGANAFISKPLFLSRAAHVFRTLLNHEQEPVIVSQLDVFEKASYAGRRSLLVEDNELNAEIAGEILGMAGLEVEYAQNGKEALDIMSRVEDGYYDIVFMDVQMPFMNGYEATRAIRTLQRDYTKRVPIIAMTANAFVEDVQLAKNAGMNEHIAKPLNFDQLQKTLDRWLK